MWDLAWDNKSDIWFTLVVYWMSYASISGWLRSNEETKYSLSSRKMVWPWMLRECHRRDSWVRPKTRKRQGEEGQLWRVEAMRESSEDDMW